MSGGKGSSLVDPRTRNTNPKASLMNSNDYSKKVQKLTLNAYLVVEVYRLPNKVDKVA